ncbi:hypothetical protein [Curtobacterium sp. MCBA15_013]|uniref:hypothetical protein n=1 Tax=Curtobacterium sp. MCBA15_013 TaxID=1898739 RepID=UPI0008DDEA66|nr:hypothetical protein [Curtobacterium sp. MCBA15_013]
MSIFKTEPEPLLIPRTAAHVFPAAFVVGVMLEASIVVGLPWGRWGEDAELRLDWLATWGDALHDDTATTLLAFVAAVLVLYGISIGGQSSFQKRVDRDNARRSAGALGVLVAVSAMVLFVFGVSAAISDPKYVPSLVVIVPTTVICWYLGIEVGRYVVPNLRQQMITARQQEAALSQRRETLTEDFAAGGTIVLIIGGRAFGLAVVSMITVAVTAMPRRWEVIVGSGGIAFLGGAVTLALYALIAASSLTETNTGKIIAMRTGAGFMYLLAAVLTTGIMVVVAPTAWAGAGVVLLLLLLGSVGFHVRQPTPGTPRARRTLRAAMAGIEAINLEQTSEAVGRRVQELEERARPIRTWMKRQVVKRRRDSDSDASLPERITEIGALSSPSCRRPRILSRRKRAS